MITSDLVKTGLINMFIEKKVRLVDKYELYHHGVKGMKWGVRRYQNKDGSLTPKGIKRYAKKGYTEDSYNSNKTKAGKIYDKVTGAHKYAGDIRYELSSGKERKARAEKYLTDKKVSQQAKTEVNRERAAKVVAKGAEVASKAAFYSAIDDVFYGGAGKKIAKEALVQTGRAAVTAYTMARGGYDIKWYDEHGRRVG